MRGAHPAGRDGRRRFAPTIHHPGLAEGPKLPAADIFRSGGQLEMFEISSFLAGSFSGLQRQEQRRAYKSAHPLSFGF
jgi:hypothetical protein